MVKHNTYLNVGAHHLALNVLFHDGRIFLNFCSLMKMTSLMPQACERCWRRKQKVGDLTFGVYFDPNMRPTYSVLAKPRYAFNVAMLLLHVFDVGSVPQCTNLTTDATLVSKL